MGLPMFNTTGGTRSMTTQPQRPGPATFQSRRMTLGPARNATVPALNISNVSNVQQNDDTNENIIALISLFLEIMQPTHTPFCTVNFPFFASSRASSIKEESVIT